MEQDSHVQYCLERIQALRYDAPKIARALASAHDILEPQLSTPGQDGPRISRPLDSMRLALLDNSLQRLKEARKLFKPIVDSSTLMLERVDDVASRLEAAHAKLAAVKRSGICAELERLSAQIALTEKRLAALNKLMEHLNPSMNSIDYDGITSDNQLNSTGCANIERVLETADNLIASQKFCNSLNELEYLKGSAVLLEASQRITANLDKVCELSYLRLQRASRRLSKVLCEAFDEASVIALKHSSSFVPSTTTSSSSSSSSSSNMMVTDEFGMSKILELHADPNSSLALRVLKLLQMRPTYLYHFVNGMRDVLGQISLKHFTAYASTCTVDPCNRNAAVSSVLEHLQHNVTFMKGCVAGLYGNAGLPFHYSESNEHGAILLKASKYLSSILETLVNPLEAKLNKVMAADTAKAVDGVITCNGIVDMFTAMQSIQVHIQRVEDSLATPWVNTQTQVGISIDNQQWEGETDVEDDGDDKEEGDDDKDDIVVGEKGKRNTSSVDNEFPKEVVEVTIVIKLKQIYDEWRKQLFSSIEERIGVPLANEPTCHIDAVAILDISAPHVIHTICEFIEDIVKIQARYATSNDFLQILESTINPTINWCQKSASQYGDHESAYLINCFARIQKALDHEVVPQSFKDLLESEMESHVDNTIEAISSELQDYLNITGMESGSDEADEVRKRISRVIFADGILGCDIATIKRLKLISDGYQRLIKSRLYCILADDYRNLSTDKDSQQVLELVEFTAQL